MHLFRAALLTPLLLILLQACTSVPLDYPREPSTAIPASLETDYGRKAADWSERKGQDKSGFVPLAAGIDALGARLTLIENAEQTIDAQYFLIKPDDAGELFLGKLLRAAERGVRVRLLIDDIFTPRNDTILAVFDSHPNIEVRLFNPVSRASPAAWSLLWNFSRVNRRMHNKAFIVDGSIAVMGGRNIAAEYFDLKPNRKFNDFEMLTFGEVVPEIATSFDEFWNSPLALPMEAFMVSEKPERRQRWLNLLDDVVSAQRQSPYAAAMDSPFVQQVLTGDIHDYVATADLVYDSPQKLLVSRNDASYRQLAQTLGETLSQAQREVIIITPYLVPRDLSYPLVKELESRGVRVVIITNSLASTNHVAVHSAYAPRRKGLLEAGAEIYEIRVDGDTQDAERGRQTDRATMHTKAVLIDRQQLFIGSLNMDPRSIEINTEIGLFIHSPEAADSLSDQVYDALSEFTYQVALDKEGRLSWRNADPERRNEPALRKEPDTSAWLRFKAGFYGVLPLDSQL